MTYMKLSSQILAGAMLFFIGSHLSPHSATANEDTRKMVKLTPMMQAHMLSNMRDHLAALNEMFDDLAQGNVDQAAEIAEKRLGMSSMSLHCAAHLGKFMPKEMGQIGTQMHRASSRFVIIARDAELEPGKASQRKVYKALADITANCNACHQGYRIR